MMSHSNLERVSQALHEHLDGLYGYAMALCRNREDAEDLVQETSLRAIRASDTLHAESRLKSWLFTISRNIWLNRLRQRQTAPQFIQLDNHEELEEIAVVRGRDPLTLFIHKTEHERVNEAIEQLSQTDREIILLREYEDLSYKEIASALKCPIGTVMSRLQRARTRLRALLSVAEEQTRG